ncbi:MAG: DUF1365 domain-containing protein [Halioglobus sp.]|nr:DUF1365 domain-containing protein [Halioglobus sp.]
MTASRIYQGTVRHRRHLPRPHAFSYRVAIPYLRLDEIPRLFARSRLWSADGLAPGQFRRSDYLGDPALPLQVEVRRRIREECGVEHRGPIYLLANPRCFGLVMNPIACYYCFNEDESRLEYLVAEVNNTPWNERYSYVLAGPSDGEILRTQFDKAFHVSPFNPMDMRYHWRSNTPAETLALHMENYRDGERVFDATLALKGEAATPAAMDRLLLRFPLMSAKVGLAIYWQALQLFLKRIPFYPHPDNQAIGASK